MIMITGIIKDTTHHIPRSSVTSSSFRLIPSPPQ